MLHKRGPSTSGQPSRQFYTCPVKNCDSKFRGDDIAKHFRTYANLVALDKANENQSNLSKSKKPTDVIDLKSTLKVY